MNPMYTSKSWQLISVSYVYSLGIHKEKYETKNSSPWIFFLITRLVAPGPNLSQWQQSTLFNPMLITHLYLWIWLGRNRAPCNDVESLSPAQPGVQWDLNQWPSDSGLTPESTALNHILIKGTFWSLFMDEVPLSQATETLKRDSLLFTTRSSKFLVLI